MGNTKEMINGLRFLREQLRGSQFRSSINCVTKAIEFIKKHSENIESEEKEMSHREQLERFFKE